MFSVPKREIHTALEEHFLCFVLFLGVSVTLGILFCSFCTQLVSLDGSTLFLFSLCNTFFTDLGI